MRQRERQRKKKRNETKRETKEIKVIEIKKGTEELIGLFDSRKEKIET